MATPATTDAASASATKKKHTVNVRPFANIHLNSTLGLVADATRQAAIKANPELAARAAAKKKAAAAASSSQSTDDIMDDGDALAGEQYDARKTNAAIYRTTVRALVLMPSVPSAAPRPARDGKKPFPGFCRFVVMVVGPPGANGNKVGLKTPGNTMAPHGRLAYLAAQTLEKVGYDEEEKKNKFEQRASNEKAVLAEGTLIDVTVSGQVARPTHTKDGTAVPAEQLSAQPELKLNDVVLLTIDDIVLRDSCLQAKGKRIQPLGTASGQFANEVLHSLAEAGQRPFTPLVVQPDFDWASVKVVRRNKQDGTDDAVAQQQQQGGGDAMDADDVTSSDKPTNDKVQAKGSACMMPESARALWTNYVVGTFGTPQDTQRWREAANQPLLLNGSPVFDPTDSQQWIKKQKEGAVAPKPGEPVEVQIRYTLPTRQVQWLTPVQCSVTSVMLNQTVPQLLLYRFGISDADYQPFVRAMICNGVFAMMASPMTHGWMTRYFDGEEFSQAFYPRMNYVGNAGAKKPDVKSAAFYVDHACTLLNSCVPVTREFIVVLMLFMKNLVNEKRYNYDMTTVKRHDRKDSMGRPFEDNYLELFVDDQGAQAVVNLFECQFNTAKELLGHVFYALVENVPKGAEAMQRVFEVHGAQAPAYFSAMLLQAFVARYNALLPKSASPFDPLKPIEAVSQLLKKVAVDFADQLATGMGDAGQAVSLPEDFVRPVGAPSLKELLSPTMVGADGALVPNPRYIGDNALQLDTDELMAFRLMPWAISRRHLEQRGLPALYSGLAVHYEVVYPRVAKMLDEDDSLVPLDKYVAQRKEELAPILAAAAANDGANNALSADEEAALAEAEAKALADAEALVAKAKAKAKAQAKGQGKLSAPSTPTKTPVAKTPTTAKRPAASALTADVPSSSSKPATTTTTTPSIAEEGDSDSEHTRQRRRKMPESFFQQFVQQKPRAGSEQADPESGGDDDNDDDDEEEGDPASDVDMEATQPFNGGVMTLAPTDD